MATSITTRFEDEMVERIDAAVEELSERAGGATLNRSDAIRVAIKRGLEVIEGESTKKHTKR